MWYIRPPIMQPIFPPAMSGHSTIVCYTLNSTASNIYAYCVGALYNCVAQHIFNTRSLGALRAPTSSWGPFGPAWLRPSRPSGAQAVSPTQNEFIPNTENFPGQIWKFSRTNLKFFQTNLKIFSDKSENFLRQIWKCFPDKSEKVSPKNLKKFPWQIWRCFPDKS